MLSHILSPYSPKLLWMKQNEPDYFAKITKVMLPKDYISYKLTGVFATDPSDASGMLLFDVEHKRWSPEMLTICSLKESQMPKVFESYESIGTLTSEIAALTGLPNTVKVAAGAGDNAAAAVGTGTVGDSRCNISIGTSGTIFITSKSFGVDSFNALHSFAHADGNYHLMGCMLSAASCNKWWSDEILGTVDYSNEQSNITPEKLGENHVFFLPYLMGERSPHNDPFARAAFLGMRMDTTRADMNQAVMEGVAFGLRDSLEVAKTLGINLERATICGGGAKSPIWRTIITNVLGINIDIVACEEGPAYGGAILAAVACGEYKTVEEASQSIVKVVDSIEPNKQLVKKYEEKYQQFRKIYPACKELFH